MSDSPKCPICFENGYTCQTYKLAGKQQFICQKCGQVFKASEFEEVEFQWKTNKPAFDAFIKGKQDSLTKKKESVKSGA